MSTSGFSRFTLVFSGTSLGTYLHGFLSIPSRVTPVNVRHNFWDSTALLDGSYPAIVWDHQFILYTEANSIGDFANTFLNLSNLYQGVSLPLKISYASSPSGTLLDFGNCFFQDKPQLQQPDLLLRQEAGFFQVSFLGNSKPT